MKQVERPGDYAVNLLHYEDAASLCLAVRHSRSPLMTSAYQREMDSDPPVGQCELEHAITSSHHAQQAGQHDQRQAAEPKCTSARCQKSAEACPKLGFQLLLQHQWVTYLARLSTDI